jgi:asparagine synthase (glutamine-hydrolysing)
LRSAIRQHLAASRLLSASLRRKLQHTIVGRGEDVASLHLDNFYCAFPAAEQHALLASEPARVYENFLRYWDSAADRSTLGRMLYADQKTYLVELLMKQDRMSMACSLESRVPFLDHTLVEFAAHIPDRLKIRGGVSKFVFKKAVEGSLPAEIVHRRKMGFPTPLSEWLSGAHAGPVATALRDPNGILAAFINAAELNRVIHAHTSGHEDATDRLWRLLNLQMWGDLFLTGRRERPSSGLLSTAT